MIHVANAPVSFGVFDLADPEHLPAAGFVLDAVSGAGYEGIDLGPVGYLGGPDELRRRGLRLAGGWVELPLAGREAPDLGPLDRVLDALLAGDVDDAALPRPTLADTGSPERRAQPGRGQDRHELRLDRAGWRRLADGVARALDRCRERDLEPTFHHHVGTFVEAPAEIERLLDLTEVGLCLDTGHLILGGGDPVQALRDWGERVNHLHLKDCHRQVLTDVLAAGGGLGDVWRRGAFRELGRGDLDLPAFLAEVGALGYRGWMVVEQDRIPAEGETPSAAAAAQERNREYLRGHGL